MSSQKKKSAEKSEEIDINKIKKELKWKNASSISDADFDKAVSLLTQQGYTVISSNKYQVVLKSPQKFNWTAFILLSLVLNIFGLIGYLIYYNVKNCGKQVILNKSISSETKK